ncbi:hypothetical protein [Bradyrhizobium neotropicale]|nr:hypothetical protein [Bradyrhizobium neotropicale]
MMRKTLAQKHQSTRQRGGTRAEQLLNLGDEAIELADFEVTIDFFRARAA